jgi:hypothetical protein
LPADELVEELLEAAMGSWVAYSLCGARIEARRVQEYTVNVYPKQAKTKAYVRRNI